MGISKVWLQEQMQNAETAEARFAFCRCYDELIKPPTKAPKQVKPVDHDKVFANIVQFYINKGKSKDEANEIAMKVVQEQKDKTLHSFKDSKND